MNSGIVVHFPPNNQVSKYIKLYFPLKMAPQIVAIIWSTILHFPFYIIHFPLSVFHHIFHHSVIPSIQQLDQFINPSTFEFHRAIASRFVGQIFLRPNELTKFVLQNFMLWWNCHKIPFHVTQFTAAKDDELWEIMKLKNMIKKRKHCKIFAIKQIN